MDRLMEQQYGQRAILDERFHKQQQQRSSSGGAVPTGGVSPHPVSSTASGQHSYGPDRAGRNASNEDQYHDRRSSSSSSNSSSSAGPLPPPSGEVDALQETIAHQKYEIVRLLNTVKTLSAENTKLLKVRLETELYLRSELSQLS